MKDSTLGIIIIIVFVLLGIFTRGAIFYGGDSPTATTTGDQLIDTPYYYADADEVANRQNAQEQLRLISAQAIDLNEEIQRRIEEENASPYRGRVQIANIYNIGTFNEYATLSINNEPGDFIVLSGWKLKSLVTGGEITIGGAANIPERGFPKEAPLVITDQYAKVIVSHSTSPINASFRLNLCTGYLDPEDYYAPSLPRECPALGDYAPSVSRNINNDCLDYIETIPRCTNPRERDYPENITRSCQAYIEENATYDTCVDKYQLDPNFLIPEWRVYAKVRGILWLENRDVIQLIDSAGKVVDTYRS
ncbi:MAG TPA: hypothetical protein VK145_02485 [Candidatus Nanoarchaeia archaeon]|nr:hypothetical protein [Candidatus Nanoarchaeia archaeon]